MTDIIKRYVDEGADKVFQDALENGAAFIPGDRVLLKAITYGDHALASTGIEVISEDARGAIVHEVVAVGRDVPEAWGLRKGLHVSHVSAAADTISPKSDHRLVLVPYRHVIIALDPNEA